MAIAVSSSSYYTTLSRNMEGGEANSKRKAKTIDLEDDDEINSPIRAEVEVGDMVPKTPDPLERMPCSDTPSPMVKGTPGGNGNLRREIVADIASLLKGTIQEQNQKFDSLNTRLEGTSKTVGRLERQSKTTSESVGRLEGHYKDLARRVSHLESKPQTAQAPRHQTPATSANPQGDPWQQYRNPKATIQPPGAKYPLEHEDFHVVVQSIILKELEQILQDTGLQDLILERRTFGPYGSVCRLILNLAELSLLKCREMQWKVVKTLREQSVTWQNSLGISSQKPPRPRKNAPSCQIPEVPGQPPAEPVPRPWHRG